MKSGYKILWTDNSLKELHKTVEYLEKHWTEKELINLATNLEKTLNLISQNPYLFQESDIKKGVRRVVILTLNSLYYKITRVMLRFYHSFRTDKTLKTES